MYVELTLMVYYFKMFASAACLHGVQSNHGMKKRALFLKGPDDWPNITIHYDESDAQRLAREKMEELDSFPIRLGRLPPPEDEVGGGKRLRL